MDFSPTERVETIRELAQKFLKSQVEPLESVVLNQGWKAAEERLPAVRERAKETGLFAPHMPEEIGGGGLSLMEQAQLSEVLGGQLLGHLAFNFAAPDVGNMELIHAFGTPEQKKRWLEPLVAGTTRSTFLMTEPEHAGSNPVWM
ncbi:MAG: acyl-CoA dehydrogenase family protein, partial [Deltaproteobacteria bacterium]|nr:acyl-CoA dehydrogenase family protein [Deltaproteobacteria bacterium]